MFKITAEPCYTVYYEKVGPYRLDMPYDWIEDHGYVHVRTLMSSKEADQLIEDLRRSYENRPRQLPFDKFRPFKFEEATRRYLCATEQGQALLEKSHKAVFTPNVTCCDNNGAGIWLLPVGGKASRLYAMRENWAREAEFLRFLQSLYSKEDGWILPE